MKMKFLCWALLGALALSAAACSDDDDNMRDPAGTVTQNLIKGKHQQGGIPLYIDADNNFTSIFGPLVELGAIRGLGSIKKQTLVGLTNLVAVTPGYGYLIYDEDAIRQFPSGVVAAMVEVPYYRVFVESWLQDGQGKIEGAVVKYVALPPAMHGLPPVDEVVPAYYGASSYDAYIELPTDDCEYLLEQPQSDYPAQLEQNGRSLKISIKQFQPDDDFYLYLRVEDSFTRVTILPS